MKPFKYKISINAVILLVIIHLTFHALLIYGLMTFSFHWLWLTLIGIILIRNVGGEIGGHRYYSHRSFEARPCVQWLMSVLFVYSYGGSVLRWSPGHNFHHRYSDNKYDYHSPHYIENIKDFIRVAFPPVIFLEKVFKDEKEKEIRNKFLKWFREERYFKYLMENKSVKFTHNYYWLIALFPILILPIIDIRLLIYLIAIPCVINIWTFILLNFYGHINLTGCYRNFETSDRSVNNPWLHLLLSTSGLHNNHHYSPSSYNLKMSDKWYEQDFLNVFLIEKFLMK